MSNQPVTDGFMAPGPYKTAMPSAQILNAIDPKAPAMWGETDVVSYIDQLSADLWDSISELSGRMRVHVNESGMGVEQEFGLPPGITAATPAAECAMQVAMRIGRTTMYVRALIRSFQP